MNEEFDKLRDVNVKKTLATAKRPIGILRHNAELMRDRGAPLKDIEEYLWDNGADMDLIMAVSSPNEGELARMIESEKSGKWAEGQQQFKDASARAEHSRKVEENLHGALNGVRAFGNGLFLNYGDELESLLTGQNVDDIRADYGEWAARHPNWDLGLGIVGGLAPTLAGFGAGGATMGKTALTRMLMGTGTGAGIGAVAGYGAGTGGWEDRLESAGYGSLFGGGIGAVAPLALGGIGRATGRFARGLGKGPSEKEVGDFILNNVVAEAGRPGAKAQNNASILFQAIQDGDVSIQNSARNLQNKMLAMSAQRNPEIVELALNPNWTAETPSAQNIMRALTTDSKRAASKKFGEFVAQQPDKTGLGLALNEYFKKNPIAKDIVLANKRRIGQDLTTYEGLQKIEDTLNRNLPKSLDNSRVVNRNAQILDAIEDLSNLRETAFPGQKVMDATYRASVGGVNDTAQKTAKSYMSQLASGVANPTNLEVSLTGASKLGLKPYVRGRARELIERGVLEPDRTSFGEQLLQSLGFGGYRTLEQQR